MERVVNQGQCEPRAESTSLLDGYAEAKPALGETKGSKTALDMSDIFLVVPLGLLLQLVVHGHHTVWAGASHGQRMLQALQ